MLIPQEVIRQKRDGGELSAEQISQFIQGITDNDVTEGQIAALAMAVYFQGMSVQETAALTMAMRDSWEVMTWDLPGPVVDKHSTGGVGDMVSLMLGPIVAACGAYVPMITGRGLGHTGGTLDKLESIPGYTAKPDNDLFRKCVRDTGVCIIGQTHSLAPADQRFYATRDITSTVESIPLITASILSKKLAEGLNGLTMDVKFGNGAFMSNYEQATQLAQSIVRVANSVGVNTHALLTDMNTPLAWTAGNSLEILETIEFLKGDQQHPDLLEVTLALAADMLQVVGIETDPTQAMAKATQALESGAAAEVFAKMNTLLGGPADLLENPRQYLPQAPIVKPLLAKQNGYIAGYDTRAVGMSVVALGGGRVKASDPIDHRVGLADIQLVGTPVEVDKPLATIHAKSEAEWQEAADRFMAAIEISEQPVKAEPRVKTIIGE